MRRAVLRLERRVRDERIGVRRLDDLGGARSAWSTLPSTRSGNAGFCFESSCARCAKPRCSAARSGLRSTSTCSLPRAVCACHQLSATIATPGIRPRVSVVPSTTNAWRTPGSALIASRLALTTLPPKTGHFS